MTTRIAPQNPSHAAGLFAALSDPRVYAFLDDAPPESVPALRARLERLQAGGSEDGSERWLNWTVFHDKSIVGYTQATVVKDRRASIAYVMSPDVWGKGVAQTACEQMIERLVTDFEIRSFVADTETANVHSRNLLARLGFSLERETGTDVYYRISPAAVTARFNRVRGNR